MNRLPLLLTLLIIFLIGVSLSLILKNKNEYYNIVRPICSEKLLVSKILKNMVTEFLVQILL